MACFSNNFGELEWGMRIYDQKPQQIENFMSGDPLIEELKQK